LASEDALAKESRFHSGGAETGRIATTARIANIAKFAEIGRKGQPSPGMKFPLILASASPRRQELLREAGISFEVHPAHIPEERKPDEAPLEYVLRLAEEKARAVARRFPERYVLGADTTVVADEHVLEKPADYADAARMLRLLSGRAHQVITAVSLVKPGGQSDTRACTTQVFFRKLSEEEIQRYVASHEPMDKAGAYAIQGGAAGFADRMEGEYSNVVGLPLSLVTEMLRTNGFR
jgi:septum formation protein